MKRVQLFVYGSELLLSGCGAADEPGGESEENVWNAVYGRTEKKGKTKRTADGEGPEKHSRNAWKINGDGGQENGAGSNELMALSLQEGASVQS